MAAAPQLQQQAAPPRDPADKSFYENLPFHGLAPPPNKVRQQTATSSSRPPSELSHNGSSGYGSTRSQNDILLAAGYTGSLRGQRAANSILFSSSTLPYRRPLPHRPASAGPPSVDGDLGIPIKLSDVVRPKTPVLTDRNRTPISTSTQDLHPAADSDNGRKRDAVAGAGGSSPKPPPRISRPPHVYFNIPRPLNGTQMKHALFNNIHPHSEMQSLSRMATLPVHQKYPNGSPGMCKNGPNKLLAASLSGPAAQRARYLQTLQAAQQNPEVTKKIQALVSRPPGLENDLRLPDCPDLYRKFSPPASVSASASTLASPSTNSSSMRGWSQDSISLSSQVQASNKALGPLAHHHSLYQHRHNHNHNPQRSGKKSSQNCSRHSNDIALQLLGATSSKGASAANINGIEKLDHHLHPSPKNKANHLSNSSVLHLQQPGAGKEIDV